jgi:opacity protein-like surface antigen
MFLAAMIGEYLVKGMIMLKKLFMSCLILTTALPSAFAGNYKHKTHYRSRTPYYKGEVYKGELEEAPAPKTIVVTQPPHTVEFTPCLTYHITPGPYLGINPGFITNYNRTASVYKAFEGTVFAGYAMLNSSFYLAAEIFGQHGAQLQNYRNDLNNNLNPIGLKTTWGAGLSVLPGFVFADPIMGYLRLGALVTHFQDAGQTTTGGQVGVGLEGSVSESWDLRAEYTYAVYQSLTGLGSPRSDQFRVGVLYRFWG